MSMLESIVQGLRNIEIEQTYVFFVDLGSQISPNTKKVCMPLPSRA